MKENDNNETKLKAKEITTLSALAKEMAFWALKKKGFITKSDTTLDQIYEYLPNGSKRARNSVFSKKQSIHIRKSFNSPASIDDSIRKKSFDPNDTFQLNSFLKNQHFQSQRQRKSRSESFQTSMTQSQYKNQTMPKPNASDETHYSKEATQKCQGSHSIYNCITNDDDDQGKSDWSEEGLNEFESDKEEIKKSNTPLNKKKSLYDRGMKGLQMKNSKIQLERMKKIAAIESQLKSAPIMNEESRKLNSNSKYIPLYERASELYSKKQAAICLGAKKKELDRIKKEKDELEEAKEMGNMYKKKAFNQYDWDSFIERQNQLHLQNQYKRKVVHILNDDTVEQQAAPKINENSKAIVRELMKNNDDEALDSVFDRLYRDNDERKERQLDRNAKALPSFKPQVNKGSEHSKKAPMPNHTYSDNDNNDIEYYYQNESNKPVVIPLKDMKSKQSYSKIQSSNNSHFLINKGTNSSTVNKLEKTEEHNEDISKSTNVSKRQLRVKSRSQYQLSRTSTDNINSNTTLFTNINNAKSKDESAFNSKGNINNSLSRVKTCVGMPEMFEEIHPSSKREYIDSELNKDNTITDFQTDISNRLYKINIRNSTTGRSNTDIIYASPSDFSFLNKIFS